MKITAIIVLFGVIIVPSLSNEHVRTHHSQRTHHRSNRNQAKLALRHFSPQGLELFLNSTSGLIGFLNVTNHVAAVFDLSTSSIVVFSGLGGNAIAIDGSSHAILKIHLVWSLGDSHFELYFRSLSGLQEVIQSGQPVNRPEVEPEISRLAAQLGVESNALECLVGASTNLHQVGAVLRALMREDHFRARGGLLRIAMVLKGIGDLFIAKPQDLQQLVNSGNHLDFPSIINAPNGLQAFLRILQSLGPVNMGPLIGNPLGSLVTVLHIIVELGGNDPDDGIDNVLRIVYNIVALIDGQGSLDGLIEALIEAGENAGVEINGADITPVIDDLLKLAESQNSLFQSGGIFNVVIRFLRDLNSNNLFLNDINISEMLQVLSKGDYKGAIDMIIRFFMHFNNMLNPAKSIPRFFGYFLTVLNSSRGLSMLPQFFPGVSPNQLQQLQGVNVTNLLQNQNYTSNIPMFGQIFNQFSGSVEKASQGNLNFTNLLNQGASQGIFQSPIPGRFFGVGLFQPLQTFNPLQGVMPSQGGQSGGGGGNIPFLGGGNNGGGGNIPFLGGGNNGGGGNIPFLGGGNNGGGGNLPFLGGGNAGGAGNLPMLGGTNITNILVNNTAPCKNSTATESPVEFTTLVETVTMAVVTTSESREKKRNHQTHGRKGLKNHSHNKHYKGHSKHHSKHENKHNDKLHGHS